MDLIIKRISGQNENPGEYELREYVQKYGLYVSMRSVAAGGLQVAFSIDFHDVPKASSHILTLLKAAVVAYEQKIAVQSAPDAIN